MQNKMLCYFFPWDQVASWHAELRRLRQIQRARLHRTTGSTGRSCCDSGLITCCIKSRLAGIVCEQNHANGIFFSISGYKKDQVLVDWGRFKTTWYWVIWVNNLKLASSDTQPYPEDIKMIHIMKTLNENRLHNGLQSCNKWMSRRY